MKKLIQKILTLSLGLAVASFPQWGLADDVEKKPGADAKTETINTAKADKPDVKGDEKKESKEPVVKRDDDGNILFHMEDELQKKAGIVASEVVATNLANEVKSFGRVLDPSALSSLVNELAMAQAAGMASGNELTRLKKLSSSGNVSERALQTAEATSIHDSLMVQSAKDKLMLSYGKEIADKNDLTDLSRSLGSTESVLIRAELPAGQSLNEVPSSARVMSISGKSSTAEALGLSPNVDPLSQSRAYVLLVKSNNIHLLPGESVTAYLQTSGDAVAGFVIPSAAVIRADGKAWLYAVKDEDHLLRREINLNCPLESGWFIREGVKTGEKIVTTGAQSAYSEEVKSSVGSGD